jgi:basic amino acid/polyamine antiporter, APA family
MIMAGPRVYAAMAEDRALPRQIGYLNARGVPMVAVIAQGVISLVFVWASGIGELMRSIGFTLAIFAALTCAALFVLRRRGFRSTYRTPGYPVTPLVFIAVSAWIAYAQIDQNPIESLVVAGSVLGVGALLYVLFAKPPASTMTPPAEPAKLPEARVLDE